jgi:hypothetical protein
MSTQMLSAASRLSDQELLAQVSILARREREATAVLVAHLAVLDERRLYLGEGCSSLFVYCTRVLHLSENAAYRRVEAARVVRAYPYSAGHALRRVHQPDDDQAVGSGVDAGQSSPAA